MNILDYNRRSCRSEDGVSRACNSDYRNRALLSASSREVSETDAPRLHTAYHNIMAAAILCALTGRQNIR